MMQLMLNPIIRIVLIRSLTMTMNQINIEMPMGKLLRWLADEHDRFTLIQSARLIETGRNSLN